MRNLSVKARRSASDGSGPEGCGRDMYFCASGLIVRGTGTTRVTCSVPSGSTVHVSAWGTGAGCLCDATSVGHSTTSAPVIAARIVAARHQCLAPINNLLVRIPAMNSPTGSRRFERASAAAYCTPSFIQQIARSAATLRVPAFRQTGSCIGTAEAAGAHGSHGCSVAWPATSGTPKSRGWATSPNR